MKQLFQSLRRHPLYSILNILGFAMALALVMLVSLYAHHQLSANQSHKDVDRIQKVSGWGTPYALKPFLEERIPEFEAITSLVGFPNSGNYLSRTPIDYTKEVDYEALFQSRRGLMQADKGIFDVFTIPFIEGSPETSFNEPNAIIISESVAKGLFPDKESVIGLPIYGVGRNSMITGVFKDFKENDSFCFDILMPLNLTQPLPNGGTIQTEWVSYSYEIFAKVRKGVNLDELQERMQKIIKDEGQLGYDPAYVCFYPFKDIIFSGHLFTRFDAGDLRQVTAMIWVAIVVLILAIINFFNLSTASNTLRTKEIGIKKVNGASRLSLVFQFIMESTVITALGFIIAFGIANLAIPWFNKFVGIEFDFVYLQKPEHWIFVIGATIAIGTIAGSYPAFYLSGFKPLDVLFTQRRKPKGSVTLVRKGLVVVQLAASTIIVICALTITNQIDFMLNKDLGFDKDQIVTHYPHGDLYRKIDPYIAELKKMPIVENVSITRVQMGSKSDLGTNVKAIKDGGETDIICKIVAGDSALVETFGLELIAGRMPRADEKMAILINEVAAGECPANDPLNTIFKSSESEYTVVGIVKDFHFKSLHSKIEPMMILNQDYKTDGFFPLINIRLTNNAMKNETQSMFEILRTMELFIGDEQIKGMIPQTLGEQLTYSYWDEKRFQTSFNIFSVFAIFVSCFGLFGLTVFSNNRRTKEIAVRRVNGSTVTQVIRLLTRNYIVLYAISLLIAVPMAYYVCSLYLEDYPYRIDFNIVSYTLASLTILFFVLLTVSLHSWWCARQNPVKNLKSE